MTEPRQAVLTGGCQCGAVRYALYAMPEDVHLCHCRMCQKAVGNAFAALAPVRRKDFAWTRGTPAVFLSSSAAERLFCAACGTPLGFAYVGGEWIDPTIGSLDDPAAVAPQQHYGVESRLPWLDRLDGLPAAETETGGITGQPRVIVSLQHPDRDTGSDWPDRHDMDALLAYLPFAENPGDDAVPIGWSTGAFPAAEYSGRLRDLYVALRRPCWFDRFYDPEAAQTLIEDDDAIARASLPGLRLLLSHCLRSERFCDGAWAHWLQTGRMAALLRRLKTLRDEDGARCAIHDNIAPEIVRQRLLVEGHFTAAVDAHAVRAYLLDVAALLDLRTYGEPVVHAPAAGDGRDENAGFDAFVPLIDSGIALYVWTGPRFLSAVFYTCKRFDAAAAAAFTRDRFAMTGEMTARPF